ncbi:PEGA domain-containing protein [Patescibacteria group bacterium]|nr:PEGA domain-containing protein [Patescibacteria group bacterium]MBU1074891.1 PEGA domain-containing protein [Patescibacteria group bacterium]MBU1951393.1 PEGA domain-containing protein [Patescibacteria group bacterium]
MTNNFKWFLVVAASVLCIMIIWIYKVNTVEESSFYQVIVRGRIKVEISVEPEDVKPVIYMDSEKVGNTTPLLLKVAPDNYLIRVEAEGYESAEQEVIVKTLRTTEVNFKLQSLE